MQKQVSLADLANKTETTNEVTVKPSSDPIKTAKPVSISDLAKNLPGKGEDEEGSKPPVVVDNAFKAMYDRIDESKNFINNVVVPKAMENAEEMAMEQELNNTPSEESEEMVNNADKLDSVEDEEVAYEAPSTDIDLSNIESEENKKEVKKSAPVANEGNEISNDIDDINDLIDELGEESEDEFTINDTDDEETVEETRERFKESLQDIKITQNTIDLSKFTIKKEPISSSVILNSISEHKTTKKADWVLLGSKRSIRMEEISGPELDSLRKTLDGSNSINGVIASLKTVYAHIVDANKPSFEKWCKTTKTEDLESIYFALYKACYGDVNLVGRTCIDPKNNKKHIGCGKTSIINIPIMDMVKYKDDETKALAHKILQQDTTTSSTVIKSEMVVASDNIAISYTEPTLYTTFIQYASLPDNITSKYSDLLNSLAYIDGFYSINMEKGELQPINVKVYPNNINKTVMSKLKVYLEVLKTLTPDQYNVLTSKLNNLIKDPDITYIYPKTICPECGTEIPEEEVSSMLSLLFTRAQLAQIKSL